MSEEIIIDGVNVAECDYFVRQRGFNCYMGKNCNETNDCYYKKLQRLKQKNEKLKEKPENQCIECESEIKERLEWLVWLVTGEILSKANYTKDLKEIKKSLLDCCSTCMQSCDDCLTDKILFKINEVLND